MTDPAGMDHPKNPALGVLFIAGGWLRWGQLECEFEGCEFLGSYGVVVAHERHCVHRHTAALQREMLGGGQAAFQTRLCQILQPVGEGTATAQTALRLEEQVEWKSVSKQIGDISQSKTDISQF